MKLSSFKKYIQGDYWPPVELRALKDIEKHPVWGTEFGVFAKEVIRKDVLIGEYCCDLLNEEDLMVGKKFDALVSYATATKDSSAVYLIPKDHCGLVPLINTASQEGEKNNCRSVKLVV